MTGMSDIVSQNIIMLLKKNKKKQYELAQAIGVDKQTMRDMLSGSRMINGVELQRIANFFYISMEELMVGNQRVNPIHSFMNEVKSGTARDRLRSVDELADMTIFYARTRENAERMQKIWEP